MRKIMMLALLLVGLTAQAQVFQKTPSEGSYSYLDEASERVAKGVKPFVKANFVVSDYVGNYSVGQKELYGYAVEAGLQIPFSLRCLGLQTALRYITKGSKVPLESGSSSRNVVRQNTIEVPVLFTMFIPTGSTGGLKIGIGPYFGYGLGGKAELSDGKVNTFGTPGLDWKRFDMGLDMDVSWETRHFAATIGMEAGFFKIHPGKFPRNRAIYMGVGYIF